MKLRKRRKALRRLEGRIEDWKNRKGDITRKHPEGFKKPGALRP